MTDPSTTSGVAVSSTGRQPSVYSAAREVSARAKVTREANAPAMARAFDRLDQALSSDQPLSQDVPRGYYLNIVV